jgi:hypothetical protein
MKKKKVLECVKCIKDEGHRVLVMEEDIIERWKSCFDKLYGSHTRNWSTLRNPIED